MIWWPSRKRGVLPGMDETPRRPRWDLDDPTELTLGLLDFYRDVIAVKLDGLTDQALRHSVLPSRSARATWLAARPPSRQEMAARWPC